jgi:hypothetical protein
LSDNPLAELRACTGSTLRKRTLRQIEDRLTPLEFRSLLRRSWLAPSYIRREIRQTVMGKIMRRQKPQRFERRELHADVILYSDPAAPRADKALVVAFTGRTARLMVPVAAILQQLPAQRFDVLAVTDKSKAHYLQGIVGYAPHFVGLCERLHADTGMNAYRNVYCLGTSMGGFCALRAGVVLKARRAVSIGGRFPWHIQRLEGDDVEVPAFEILCSCVDPGPCELICCYSTGFQPDAEAARGLAATFPVRLKPVEGHEEHNFIHPFLLNGRLSPFLGELLDFEPESAGPNWLSAAAVAS